MSDKCVVCGENPRKHGEVICIDCLDDWHSYMVKFDMLWDDAVTWAAKRARLIATRQFRRTDRSGESHGDNTARSSEFAKPPGSLPGSGGDLK